MKLSCQYVAILTATALFAGIAWVLPAWATDAPEFYDCIIGDRNTTLSANCTNLSLPLNPTDSSSESIDLFIARLPAFSNNPQPDAFTLIAGGPGQSATESFPAVAFAFRHIRQHRDVILIDQRGTGRSDRLDCPEQPATAPVFDFDSQRIEKLAIHCLAELTADPRYFTTSIAVKDIEAVRMALGIEQWNIYGVSYGTRVGLHYLRRFPNRVRSLVLDAVVPPQVALGPEIAQMAQQALDKLFTRCQSDKGCANAFPDLAQQTRQLIENLADNPRTVQFEDINTGQLRSVEFTDQHLAVTIRLLSYSAHGNSILPSMLYEAITNNNFAPLARQAEMQTRQIGSALATGMHNAIICTEDAPFIPQQLDLQALENTYLGADLIDALRANCNNWPAGVHDPDFRQPVSSAVPTLILSGSADPITPPIYGEQIATTLSRSRHIVNADQGHMQAPLGCMPSILAQFVQTPNPDTLSTDCLKRLQPPAFFVDANGPLP